MGLSNDERFIQVSVGEDEFDLFRLVKLGFCRLDKVR